MSYATLGINTESPGNADAYTQLRVLRPKRPDHPLRVHAGLVHSDEVKMVRQEFLKDKVKHQKEMQTTVKQMRMLRLDIQRAQVEP